MAAAAPVSSRWLHGPGSDIALGTGLLYVPVFAWIAVAGDPVSPGMMPLLVLALSTPHLGATLLRVYERPEDRRAYRLFAVWVTLVMGSAFLVGLHVHAVGSLLITLYLTVVPWHFTGQNYGIALIFLRRSGVDVAPELKRFLYASFVLPYVLWILGLHGDVTGTAEYAPLGAVGTVYAFWPVGIPGAIQGAAVLVATVIYLYVLGECILGLRRRATLRQSLPAAALMLVQGLWFAAPIVSRIWLSEQALGPLAPGRATQTFIWISLLHALQYLWITTYYARKQRPERPTSRFLIRALLAGAAIYGFPILLLAPGVVGRLPYDSGLFLMVAGAINLHHVMLDGVIWKLRNTRIASILIRGAEADPAEPPARRASWFGPAVWASGAVAVVLTVAGTLESEFGVKAALARADADRLEAAVNRLRWMGRDDPALRSQLGVLLLEAGDTESAAREFDHSLDLFPTPAAWINLGVARERNGRMREARDAYDAAVNLDPEDVNALFYAGRAQLNTDPVRARELLGRAAELAPDRDDIRRVHTRAMP